MRGREAENEREADVDVWRFSPHSCIALTNPRESESQTSLVPTEVPPTPTDHSLSEFGEPLNWTPRARPPWHSAPLLKLKQGDTHLTAPSDGPRRRTKQLVDG